MNRKAKKRMGKRKRMKDRARRTEMRLEEWEKVVQGAQMLARADGMEMRWNRCQSGQTGGFLHVMIEADGKRLLEWWPSNGRWWCVVDGKKGKCDDIDTILWMAARIREEGASPEMEQTGADVTEMESHLDSIARQ